MPNPHQLSIQSLAHTTSPFLIASHVIHETITCPSSITFHDILSHSITWSTFYSNVPLFHLEITCLSRIIPINIKQIFYYLIDKYIKQDSCLSVCLFVTITWNQIFFHHCIFIYIHVIIISPEFFSKNKINRRLLKFSLLISFS